MGKKKVFGCLGIAGIIILVVVILAYSFVVKPFQSGLANLEEIHKANEKIENEETYEPPEDGELKPEQVDRFVTVQKEISENLEQEITLLKEQYEELGEELENREPKISEMLTAWDDVLQLYAKAKNIQVEALNEQDFSLSEYEFVRQAFYNALGHELMSYRIDSIAEAAEQGDFAVDFEEFEKESAEISEEAMEQNKELVSEYSEEAEEWLFHAWWGL